MRPLNEIVLYILLCNYNKLNLQKKGTVVEVL